MHDPLAAELAALAVELSAPLRILVLDIETSPTNAYVWGLWGENIPIARIIEPGSVICWGAQWHGQKKQLFASVHHDGRDEMVRQMHALLEEADAVVTYNGKRFDLKHLRREFLLAGLDPPSPWHDIDLYQTARSTFAFQSNKLEFISQQTGIGQKVKHEGFELWTLCMAGDDKAWQRMKRYCLGDVALTDRLYVKLLPWIKAHPHQGLATEIHDSRCGRCGSRELVRRGYVTTKVRRYQKFQCKACGGWSRGQHMDRGVGIRPI